MRVRVGVVSVVVVVVLSCVDEVIGTVVVSVRVVSVDVTIGGAGVVSVIVVVSVVTAGVVSTVVVLVCIGVLVTTASDVTLAELFSGTMFTFVLVPTAEGLPLPGAALLE